MSPTPRPLVHQVEELEPRRFLSTSLAATLDTSKLPGVIVPGDKLSVPIVVTNPGSAAVSRSVSVRLLLSQDQTADGGDLVLANLPSQSIKLAPGKGNKTIKAGFVLPSTRPAGDYFLIAEIDAGHVISPETVFAKSTSTVAVAFRFGTFAGRKNVQLVVTDNDGSAATYKLTGNGMGELSSGGGLFDLLLTGTDAKSSVSISNKGGDKRSALSDITVQGSLKALNAGATDITGDFTFHPAGQSTGSAASISIGDMAGGLVNIPGSGVPLTFKARDLAGAELHTASPIKSASVNSWTGLGALVAPQVVTLTSKLALEPDITVTGIGVAPKKLSLGTVKAGGAADGRWIVTGDAGSLSAGAYAESFTVSVTGKLKSITSLGTLSGIIASASLDAFTAKANIESAQVLVGANLGADGRTGGSGANADTFTGGVLKSVKITGNATGLVIRTGVSPVNTFFDDGDDQIIAGGTLASFAINGTLSDDSAVIAAALPKSVILARKKITTTQDPRFRTVPLQPAATITVAEGDRFATQRTRVIDLGTTGGTRTLSLNINSVLDSTDLAPLEDTLAVYLVKTSDPTQTLLDKGEPGSPFFTLTGDTAGFTPGKIQYVNGRLTVDLTDITSVNKGTLIFQAINADDDEGTSFAVSSLTNQLTADGVSAPAFAAESNDTGRPGEATDLTALTATNDVTVIIDDPSFSDRTGEFAVQARLVNNGAAIGRNAAVVFRGLPEGVTLLNASGLTDEGLPYVNMRNAVTAGGLATGGESAPVQLTFSNPRGERFVIQPDVLVGGPNRAPEFTAPADVNIHPGDIRTLQLFAFDPDGDPVTFSFDGDAPTPSVTVSASGKVTVSPTPDNLGTFTLHLTASDGRLTSQQDLVIHVTPDPVTTTRLSGQVLDTDGTPLVNVPVTVSRLTAMTDADGRFTIEFPSELLPTEPFPIVIPQGDPSFDPMNTGTQFISFRRARYDTTTGTDINNPRRHTNLVTAYLDASMVYGSDEERASALRTHAGGRLKTSANDLLPLNNPETFPDGLLENDDSTNADPTTMFVAGDVRASENSALTAIHTVLLREHNRIADEIAADNPTFTDEEIYQRARAKVGAIVQHITYSEYLPVLLGADAIPAYTGYDANVDAQTGAFFTTVAFRLGHTQMVSQLLRIGSDNQPTAAGPLPLRESFFNTAPIRDGQLDDILRGLAAQSAQRIDSKIVDELRNFLFGPPGSGGMDLPAMTIQRGRDMGLPSYVQARLDYGLSPITDFSQISSDTEVQAALQATYGSVDKIDAFVGGISEDHAPGALVGPLFKAAIASQFQRSRDGDRFWYENGRFTQEDLDEIRATSLASLIERNTDITGLSGNLFTAGAGPASPAPAGDAAPTDAAEFRTITAEGNNAGDPQRGAARGNLLIDSSLNYSDGISEPNGTDRPLARAVTNGVLAQSQSIPDPAGTTAMAIFWGQIISHDLALTPTGTSDTIKFNADQLQVEGKSYPFVAEKIKLLLGRELFEGANNVIERPVYLPSIDTANGDIINPLQDTTIDTAAIPGASAFVAAGTLKTRDGSDFSGLMSITRVPSTLTPAALPPNVFPDTVVTIQPADMVFTTPAPLTLPNTAGYAPGTVMDLWSINPITGVFDNVGQGEVSDDGSIITTIEGGIRNSSWHFFAPPPPEPEFPDGPNPNPNNDDPTNPTGECPDECTAEAPLTSTVELHSGAVIEHHSLPTYSSMNTPRGVTLVYDSLRADPRPIVHVGVGRVQANQYLTANMTLQRGDTRLIVPGYAGDQLPQFLQTFEGSHNGGAFLDLTEGDHLWQTGSGGRVKAAIQGDLRSQPSGIYRYDMNVRVGPLFLRESARGSISFDVYTIGGSGFTTHGTIVNVNETDSPFGAGWGVAGLQKLVANPDGSILLIDGNGAELAFGAPISDGGPYVSPTGDFSVLEKFNDGTFTRTMKDRTVYRFDANMRLVSVTDADGMVTRYAYDGAGRLTSITDPVNLVTTFAYGVDGLVDSITDPAGRTTSFQHDAAGNLTKVTDPDSTHRDWEYDEGHHMVGETDQMGEHETTIYGFHGRATGAVRKDGRTLQVQAVQTLGLFPDSQTVPVGQRVSQFEVIGGAIQFRSRPLYFNVLSLGVLSSAPVVAARMEPVASYSDGNGNVSTATLNGAGEADSARDRVGKQPTNERTDGLVTKVTNGRDQSMSITYDDRGNPIKIRDSLSTETGESVALFEGVMQNFNGFPFSTAVGDINNDGVEDVVAVLTSGSNRGVASMLGNDDGTFQQPTMIAQNLGSGHILLADLNNDSRLDIVVDIGQQKLSTLPGNGDGTFGAVTTIITGISGGFQSQRTFDAVDVNNDNHLDLVLIESSSLKHAVLLGDGTGQFASPITGGDTDFRNNVIATFADFNGDDKIDILAGWQSSEQVNGTISLMLGNGDGTFNNNTDTAVTPHPALVKSADIDHDDDLDLVIEGGFPSNLSIVLNNGDGTFTNTANLAFATEQVGEMQLGDMNGDGNNDIVATRDAGFPNIFRGITIHLGNGDGTFGSAINARLTMQTLRLKLADTNGDGALDVIASDFAGHVLNLRGNGDGTLNLVPTLGDTGSQDAAIADLNGDGNPDVVTTTVNFIDLNTGPVMKVHLGNGDGTFAAPLDVSVTGFSFATVSDVAPGDFDADGLIDLMVLISGGVNPVGGFYKGKGDGTFETVQTFGVGEQASSIATGDFNGDGRLDFVCGQNNPGFAGQNFSIVVGINTGNGFGMNISSVTAGIGRPGEVTVGDLNKDGFDDIVLGNEFNHAVTVILSNGDGTFAAATDIIGGGTLSRAVALSDVDKDGDLDIVWGSFNTGSNYILSVARNNGAGVFGAPTSVFIGNSFPSSIEVADFTGDGNPDVLLGTESGFSFLYPGNGTGAYSSHIDIHRAGEFAVGDVNRDGKLDYVASDVFAGAALLINSPSTNTQAIGEDRFTYDPIWNKVTSHTDPLGHVTLYEIDPGTGDQLSVTHVIGVPGGGDDLVTSYTYLPGGFVDTITDPMGRVSDYDYDAGGRIVKVTSAKGTPDEGSIQYEYDAAGNLAAITDANQNRTEFEYDLRNRPTIVRDALGNETISTYDAAGRLLTTTDPEGRVTSYDYDARGHVTKVTAPDGQSVTYTYDGQGNKLTATDSIGQTTTYTYDARGRRTSITTPDGGVTRYTFDADGNMTTLTDARGNRTSFVYDARGRLLREIDPFGRIESYSYDPLDRVVNKTDRNGKIIHYAYDDAGMLVSEKWLGTGGQTITYAYDAAGEMTSVTDNAGTLLRGYDARGRVTSESTAFITGGPTIVMNYTYDAVGNILTTGDAIDAVTGSTTSYAYDAANRMTRATQSGGGASDKRVDIAYNKAGQRTTLDRFADLLATTPVAQTTLGYSTIGQVQSIIHKNGGAVLDSFAYTFDTLGRRATLVTPGGTTTFAYNNMNELTAVDRPGGGDESFSYDKTGNRTGNGVVIGADNRLASDGTFNYTYDNNGNVSRRTTIVTGETRDFVYDHRNRLVSVTDKSQGGASLQVVTYVYDALDRRIAVLTDATPADAQGPSVMWSVYDGDDIAMDFTDADGLAGGDAPAMANRYFHGVGLDQLFAEDRGGGDVRWRLDDATNSTTDLLDNAGNVVNHIEYNAFGSVRSQTNAAQTTRFLFNGRELDAATGFYDMRARVYDPRTGRFLSQDPLGFGGGDNNLYRFAANNPLTFSDPTGHNIFILSEYEGIPHKGVAIEHSDGTVTVFEKSGDGPGWQCALGSCDALLVEHTYPNTTIAFAKMNVWEIPFDEEQTECALKYLKQRLEADELNDEGYNVLVNSCWNFAFDPVVTCAIPAEFPASGEDDFSIGPIGILTGLIETILVGVGSLTGS